MTIKKRIVIWYTLWMALLVIAAAVVFVSASGVMMQREVIKNLEEVVHDAAEDIRIRNGRLFWDDVDFFDDGVYISIWKDGEIISGRFPEEAPFAAISIDSIQNISDENGSWYFLDIPLGENYFIRGAERAYDMGLILSSMHLMVIILLPLILILAAFGGYVIVRRSFAPADKVIATAGDIADSDDLSKRIALGPGNDEIHQMAFAFDLMLDRIEEAFEKEKQFTSDASHELRTPISVILAETDYASGHTDDQEKMVEALDVISRQAEKMSLLVSELLTLARADKATLKLHLEEFDLAELGEMVVSTLEDRAAVRNISIFLKCQGSVMVIADQGMITRVLINLLSNAIQYGREGGFAILRISSEGSIARIAVEDNGIGISAENIDKIWNRFYQVDSSRTSDSSPGAGLGLSIVKEIVECHHGDVYVESIEGQGSTFTVAIPLKPETEHLPASDIIP